MAKSMSVDAIHEAIKVSIGPPIFVHAKDVRGTDWLQEMKGRLTWRRSVLITSLHQKHVHTLEKSRDEVCMLSQHIFLIYLL